MGKEWQKRQFSVNLLYSELPNLSKRIVQEEGGGGRRKEEEEGREEENRRRGKGEGEGEEEEQRSIKSNAHRANPM